MVVNVCTLLKTGTTKRQSEKQAGRVRGRLGDATSSLDLNNVDYSFCCVKEFQFNNGKHHIN